MSDKGRGRGSEISKTVNGSVFGVRQHEDFAENLQTSEPV